MHWVVCLTEFPYILVWLIISLDVIPHIAYQMVAIPGDLTTLRFVRGGGEGGNMEEATLFHRELLYTSFSISLGAAKYLVVQLSLMLRLISGFRCFSLILNYKVPPQFFTE